MFSIQPSPIRDLINRTFESPSPFFQNVFDSSPLRMKNYSFEENEEASVVTLALPGVLKEDIDIEAHEDKTLRVSVTRDEKYGKIGLPTEEKFRAVLDHPFVAESVETTFEHGVLEIRIPKAEERDEGKKILVA